MSVASKFYTPISTCSFHTEMPLPQGSPRPAWPHLRPHRTLKSALRLRKYTCTGMIIYVHRKQNISTTESDEKFHAVMRSISLVCDCLQPQMQQSTLTFGPPKSGPPKILGHIRVHVLASPERIVMKTQPWHLGGSWRKVGNQFQNGEQQLEISRAPCRWFRIVNKYHLGLELGQMIREAVYLRKIYTVTHYNSL